jgi:hypothetical protein
MFGESCPSALFRENTPGHPSMKIVHWRFVPQTHRNALCEPQIAQDVKTQVQRNVSWRAFYEIHTRPIWTRKIVYRHFMCWMHQNAECTTWPTDKTRCKKINFCVTCPDTLFMETTQAHPSMKNIASTFCSPDALECTLWLTDPIRCKNTNSAYSVPVGFLWKPHRAHPSMKNNVSMFHASNAPECTPWLVDNTRCKNISSA